MATEVQEVSFYKDGEFYTHGSNVYVTDFNILAATSSDETMDNDKMEPIRQAILDGKMILATNGYLTYQLIGFATGGIVTVLGQNSSSSNNVMAVVWTKNGDVWNGTYAVGPVNPIYTIPYEVWSNSTDFTQSDIDEIISAIHLGKSLVLIGYGGNRAGQCLATSTNNNMLTLVVAYPTTGTIFRLTYIIYNKTSGSWAKTYRNVDFADLVITA